MSIEISKETRKTFANHKATMTEVVLPCGDKVQFLYFRRDNRQRSAIEFTLFVNEARLLVSGDWGSSVFQWGAPDTFEFIAGCDVGYFAEKCLASRFGYSLKTWDEDAALEGIQELKDSGDAKWEWGERNWEALRDAAYDEFEFLLAVEDSGLDNDSKHDLFVCGKTVDKSAAFWLEALQLALKNLEEEGSGN